MKPTLRRRIASAVSLLTAVALVAAVAPPATAAPAPRLTPAVRSYTAPVRIAPNGCSPALLVFDGTGRGHGFTTCPQAAYIEGAGSSWKVVKGADQGIPASVADDGVNTYALFSNGFGVLRLLIRSRATGRLTVKVLSTTYYGGPNEATVIGRGGRWWAVWGVSDGGCACNQLWTARTMLTPYSAHRTTLIGANPYLANRGSSAILTWSQGYTWGGSVAVGYPTTSGFTQSRPGFAGIFPSVSVAGGTLRLTYQTGFNHVVYQQLVNGHWSGHTFTRTLTYRSAQAYGIFHRPVPIVVSGSVVRLGWSTPHSSTVHATVVAKRVGSTWTETLVSDGLTSPLGNDLASMGMAGSQTVLVITHVTSNPNTTFDVVRRG